MLGLEAHAAVLDVDERCGARPPWFEEPVGIVKGFVGRYGLHRSKPFRQNGASAMTDIER